MDKKMTNWFPSYIKPVHVGVYQVDRDSNAAAFWDGRFWGFADYSINKVINCGDKSSYQHTEWRGFTEKQS